MAKTGQFVLMACTRDGKRVRLGTPATMRYLGPLMVSLNKTSKGSRWHHFFISAESNATYHATPQLRSILPGEGFLDKAAVRAALEGIGALQVKKGGNCLCVEKNIHVRGMDRVLPEFGIEPCGSGFVATQFIAQPI